MEFTGERFIPGLSDNSEIEIEHLQRYYALENIVSGKTVLDASCGEGYGSMFLAGRALNVTGIDISQETIEYARSKYRRDNLEFICASISDIPLEDKSIDIVVSFETIEHVEPSVQYDFMHEVLRVLKDDGVLVISTPDKEVYSELYDYKNPYHVKEFNKGEFLFFLKNHFVYAKLYYQRFEIVSLINSGEEKTINVNDLGNNIVNNGKYLVAVCSNTELDITLSSIIFESNNKLMKLNNRIIETQNEIENLSSWGKWQDEEIVKKDELIQTQNERIEELSKWGKWQDEEIVKKDELIQAQNERIEELSKWGKWQDEEIVKKDELIQAQNERIEELGKWGKWQDGEIAKRDKLVQAQNERIEKLSNWGKWQEEEIKKNISRINELSHMLSICENEKLFLKEKIKGIETTSEEVLATKENHIKKLEESQKELTIIYNSRGWKLLNKLYRLEDKIIPLHSKRREALKSIYFMPRNIKNIIRHINKENVKKLFKYIRTENPKQVVRHIKSYLNRYKPIQQMELKLYSTNQEYAEISFQQINDPLVSIIIPVYNQWNYTYSCLNSIYDNSEGIEYEVIIADDVSNDDTQYIRNYVRNVVVIRNEKNLGFLLNCNNAAKRARGKYILFLNNDTNVQKGWLKYLLELIEKDEQIGMVGSKLVYPDGRLQEAGGIIWNDASGWNYGRLDDPEKPEYNYVKEVDYISGASIMIRSDLWKQIGGFDTRYVPAYFEDSDLAFEVRKHGYKVMYQPKSVVIHFEGVSNGTDTNSGIKIYQIKNKEKFFKKWHNELSENHFRNGYNVFTARDRSNKKTTVLFIDHYVPAYDKDAGSRTIYQYLIILKKMGYNIKFIGDNFYKFEPYVTELEQMGIEILYGVYYLKHWKEWIIENKEHIDVVFTNRPHISIKYIEFLTKNTDAKIVYNVCDLHFLREQRQYAITKDSSLLESAKKWETIEYSIMDKVDEVFTLSTHERDIINKHFNKNKATICPIFIYDDFSITQKKLNEKKDLIFVGGFTHTPNVDGVQWFVKEVFPAIQRVIPEIKLHIVGSNATDDIKKLTVNNGVILHGYVLDKTLLELYNSCRLCVIPLRFGAGVKGKTIEAMYNQIPIVSTSIGLEGLDGIEDCILPKDSAEDFASEVIKLYEDEKEMELQIINNLDFVRRNYSEDSAKRLFEMVFRRRENML